MKKELQRDLYARYPELFRQASWTMNKTCMCWGVCTGDGWFNIINNLCSEIMSYCSINSVEPPEFSQIKEKFGLLRVYVDNANEKTWDLIGQAERESEIICEYCGKFGPDADVTTEGCWVKTLCKECRDKGDNYALEDCPRDLCDTIEEESADELMDSFQECGEDDET